MTKINMKERKYYHALGVGLDYRAIHPVYKNINCEGLSLYYIPVPKEQYNDKMLPKLMKDVDWFKNEVLEFSHLQNQLNTQTQILPFRFGTVYSAQIKMKEFLRKNKKAVKNNLEHIKNKSEWGLKVYLSRSTFKEWFKSKEGLYPINHPQRGADYFVQKKQEIGVIKNEEKEINLITKQIEEKILLDSYDMVSIDFVEENSDTNGSLKVLSNYAVLVEDKFLKNFEIKVKELNTQYHDLGMSFRVSGPWPAFNFVQMGKS